METFNANNNLIDGYLKLLHSLSPNNKLELISKLILSLKKETEKKDYFYKAFGAWESSKSADQMISDIKKTRKFKRRIEKL